MVSWYVPKTARSASQISPSVAYARTASRRYGIVFPVPSAAFFSASTEPVAWAEGEALAFADAIEYARRSRGERSRPTVGWASLTPTEQRVAAIVAEGHSNDEVARQLLMSVATVKTHLTHIYAKTGVTSRAGLAAALARR